MRILHNLRFFIIPSLVTAAVVSKDALAKEQYLQPRASCENTATSRSCWGDYSIDTNWYDETPDTGVVREYSLVVQNLTLAPDGYARHVLAFNGQIPGPTIIADWGDTITINVSNALENNGTSIHWHGLRQLGSSEFDGVPGVTQCPIAPGESMTYTFRATQYGTTWYHSHFSLQYADGLYGALIINGPATANYDEDLGVLLLSDWGHESAFTQWDAAVTGGPPVLENGLINGTNVYNCSESTDSNCLGTGTRYETTFISGTKYRIRLVNTAADGHFRFAIDSHNFTVIANDLVPIVPYETDNILITMGQRYDIIVEALADPDVDNYWMRAIWQTSCSSNDNADNILGIVRYDTSSTADPTTTATTYTSSCGDEASTDLVPYLSLTVGDPSLTGIVDLDLDSDGDWAINSSSLYLNWSSPTTLRISEDLSIWPTDYNVYPLDSSNSSSSAAWVYWVIQDSSGTGIYHPIHLHGHDFFVLAQGSGTYGDGSTTALNLDNPPRRDVASLPGDGFLAIAFQTDNPGSWLMHCHIVWHASEGLALQFVENESEISATISNPSLMNDTCNSWTSFYGSEIYPQDDSGI